MCNTRKILYSASPVHVDVLRRLAIPGDQSGGAGPSCSVAPHNCTKCCRVNALAVVQIVELMGLSPIAQGPRTPRPGRVRLRTMCKSIHAVLKSVQCVKMG